MSSVNKQLNYPVKSPRIKKKLAEFLQKRGIVSDSLVYIYFVGENKMKDLSAKFLKERNKVHDVLSFPGNEVKGRFVYPDNIIRLGEIYICYPEVVKEAKKENILIDDKIDFLIEHGGMHLLGEHHE